MYFINQFTGWIVGESYVGPSYDQIILKTNDGGETWTEQTSGFTFGLYSVFFLNELKGWAIGSGGIIGTTNGGIDWYLKVSGLNRAFYSIFFIDDNVGWVAGGGYIGDGIILKTTDGGENWVQQAASQYLLSLKDLHFIDYDYGWAVGSVGTIIKTTDGGSTWIKQGGVSNSLLTSVYFTNQNTGWAVGYWGYCFKTTNGGTNWIEQGLTDNYLYCVNFLNESTGWIVGDGGTILKTTNGGITFIEDENNFAQPKEFLMQQNYPNPFNPSTKISWQSPVSSHQVLKVFDVLGREVATLVDEYRNAGYHEIEFNAAGLSSGVYFYRIQVGDFIETKKMVLLR